MRVLFVTHSDCGLQVPRTLSVGGRMQAVAAAQRLRDLLDAGAVVAWIASSQAVRTLDTAMTVATELGATVYRPHAAQGAVELTTVPALNFRPPGQLSSASIDAALQALELPANPPVEHVALIGVHADIGGALPGAAEGKLHLRYTENGWFRHDHLRRPILAICEHQPGQPFAQATLLHCEGHVGGVWQSLVEG